MIIVSSCLDCRLKNLQSGADDASISAVFSFGLDFGFLVRTHLSIFRDRNEAQIHWCCQLGILFNVACTVWLDFRRKVHDILCMFHDAGKLCWDRHIRHSRRCFLQAPRLHLRHQTPDHAGREGLHPVRTCKEKLRIQHFVNGVNGVVTCPLTWFKHPLYVLLFRNSLGHQITLQMTF